MNHRAASRRRRVVCPVELCSVGSHPLLQGEPVSLAAAAEYDEIENGN